jgi:hypothetical protein
VDYREANLGNRSASSSSFHTSNEEDVEEGDEASGAKGLKRAAEGDAQHGSKKAKKKVGSDQLAVSAVLSAEAMLFDALGLVEMETKRAFSCRAWERHCVLSGCVTLIHSVPAAAPCRVTRESWTRSWAVWSSPGRPRMWTLCETPCCATVQTAWTRCWHW